MGMIGNILGVLFGGNRNVVRETFEAFRPNAEAEAVRDAAREAAALAQFAAEFGQARKGWFDRFIDGLNRLPRPLLALGTIGLFVTALTDPIWFAARMQGISLVPEPLWWLLGVVVSFYFGARHQIKSQQFQRSIAYSMARTAQVSDNLQRLKELAATRIGQANAMPDVELATQALEPEGNAALSDWQKRR